MENYNIEVKEILEKYKTSELGLTDKDAKTKNLKYGPNALEKEKKESKFIKFLKQFNNLLIIILLFASVLSFGIAVYEKHSVFESVIILVIVVLNATFGFFQELKSDNAIEELEKLQLTKVKVKRMGAIKLIDSKLLVPGDIISLEAGDIVPADARIISEVSLKVEEASLTGESVPSEKNNLVIKGKVPLSERTNMIYSGTSIVYGKCLAVVTNIGMDTEIGKIAKSLNDAKTNLSPLQVKIHEISKVITFIILFIIVIIFALGLNREMPLSDTLMLSIALAVAAIPEGLPAVITITLSLGMSKMAKEKAVVRTMNSVETLGSTEIICSDKTGTITQNKMTVRELYYNNEFHVPNDLNEKNIFLKLLALNNDVKKEKKKYIGDPTEIALYVVAETNSDIKDIIDKHKRVSEIPFDSERKMMSTINKYSKDYIMITKGSTESILKYSKKVLINNKEVPLNKKELDKIKKAELELSNKAYRVLAFSYKKVNKNEKLDKLKENNLTFCGLVAMIDPPRVGVKESIELCRTANVKPIMITGDSLPTAIAIAREVGILNDDIEAITGAELDKMSKKELTKNISKYSVYARVSPTNKVDIVNAWKKKGKVVAMTGDGVNDAPSIKSADIGIGMGITGTEVSKGVSDIVLLDDSFSTIVKVIEEGRRIFDNIRNVIVYLLAANITEVVVVFVGIIFNFEIFIPIQLLYVNLVSDSFPAIALAFEEASPDVMNRKVRKKDSSFFTPFLISKIVSAAIIKSTTILTLFFIGNKYLSFEEAATMAFTTLLVLEMLYAFSCRNLKHVLIGKGYFSNKVLTKSIIGIFILQALILVTPIRNLFSLVELDGYIYLIIIGICLVAHLLEEINKIILRKVFKDS